MTWSLFRLFGMLFGRSRALLVVALLVVVWILSTAASGNAETTALVLAGTIGAASPFVIQFVKNTFGFTIEKKKMVAAAYIIAAAIGLVALWLTGNLNFQDPAAMAETIGAAAALQSFVYAAFKDGKLGPYLT